MNVRKPAAPTRQAARLLLVRTDGRFLAINRRGQPDVLCLPGGKVEPGESMPAAALRETLEETGVTVPESALQHLFTGTTTNDTRHDQAAYTVATFVADWTEACGPAIELEPGLRPRWVDEETFSRTCARPGYDLQVMQAWRQSRSQDLQTRRPPRRG